MDIIVPEGWDDVTVNQYQALKEIKPTDYSTDLAYANVVLQILCDIPTAEGLTLDVVGKIMPYLKFTNSTPSNKILKTFEHEGDSYSWIGDFGQLTLGEAVSIEQIIDLEELTFDQSLDVVLGVLLRKNNASFTAESFAKNRIDFGSLPISKVNGMLLFFLNGGQSYINSMRDYSIITAATKRIIQRKSSPLKKRLIKLTTVVVLSSGYQLLISCLRVIHQTMKQLMK